MISAFLSQISITMSDSVGPGVVLCNFDRCTELYAKVHFETRSSISHFEIRVKEFTD